MSDPGSKVGKWRRMAGAGIAAPHTAPPQQPAPAASLAEALNDPLHVARSLEQKIGSIRERMDALQLQMQELEKAGASKEEWKKVDEEVGRLSGALGESQEDLEEIGRNVPGASDPRHTPEMAELALAIGRSLSAVNDLAHRAENLEDELGELAKKAPAQSASLAAGVPQRPSSTAPVSAPASATEASGDRGNVAKFFSQEVVELEGSSVTSSDLYEAYVDWADANGMNSLAMPTFARLGRELASIRQEKVGGRLRYIGVALKKNFPGGASISVSPGAGAAPPDVETIQIDAQLERLLAAAAEKIKGGTPVDEALKPTLEAIEKAGGAVSSETKQAIATAARNIQEMKQVIAGMSPEERAQLAGAVAGAARGGGQATMVANTPALQRADTLFQAVAAAAQSVKLPPKMRGYGKLMYARPAGEVIFTAGEAGIVSLMATAFLGAVGIPVTPYSLLHIGTYLGSAGGLGTLNMATKADVVLRSAAEGSLKPIVGDPAKGNRFSFGRTLTSGIRLPILLVSVGAAIGVAQGTIGTTDSSQRVAGGMAEPLEKFATKKRAFDARLLEFSKIPDKIFEIARKIEEGKPSGAAAAQRQKGSSGGYVAWSPAERVQMMGELKVLFENAGLPASLVDTLKFGDPRALGYGPAAKFKEALQTGNTDNVVELGGGELSALARIVGPQPNTAAYVTAIRTKMGLQKGEMLESRIRSIVQPFLGDPVLSEVNQNLLFARQIEAVIRQQSEDQWATFERSFLHGAAPIGPEAVMPYALAIINSRNKIDTLSKEKLEKPVGEVFSILNQALGAVGASVSLVTPQVGLDTSDMERLSHFIQEISGKKAEQKATEETMSQALDKIYDTFVPGGQKWEDTKKYLAASSLRGAGYEVRVRGNDTFVYKRIAPLAADATQKKDSGPSFVRRMGGKGYDVYAQWYEHLFGGKKAEEIPVWNFDLAKVEAATDEELGEYVLQQLNLVAIRRLRGMMEKKIEDSANWNPTMDTAVTNEFFNMTSREVGATARRQILMQLRFGGDPRAPIMILEPAAWTAIQYGVTPPSSATPIEMREGQTLDPAIWQELPAEEAKRLFESYQNAAAWKGALGLSGGVGALILGVMLASLYRVYSLNRRLRQAGPDFEKLLKEAEEGVVNALDTINDSLGAIPVLRELPRMDLTMLHAALRRAAEETFPVELSEDPGSGSKWGHFFSEAFARGPYAHSVTEIMSFLSLVEKLQGSRRMQKKFIDIIAPGSARAEKISKRLSIAAAQGGDAYTRVVSQLEQIPKGVEREIFRDSARGNLRFRIAVLDAQKGVCEALRTEYTRRPDPDQTINSKRATVLDEETARIDGEKAEFSRILAQLDRETAFERVTQAYAPPRMWERGRRSEQTRADDILELVIPSDLMANKTFSAPAAIIEDVRARVDALVTSR